MREEQYLERTVFPLRSTRRLSSSLHPSSLVSLSLLLLFLLRYLRHPPHLPPPPLPPPHSSHPSVDCFFLVAAWAIASSLITAIWSERLRADRCFILTNQTQPPRAVAAADSLNPRPPTPKTKTAHLLAHPPLCSSLLQGLSRGGKHNDT